MPFFTSWRRSCNLCSERIRLNPGKGNKCIQLFLMFRAKRQKVEMILREMCRRRCWVSHLDQNVASTSHSFTHSRVQFHNSTDKKFREKGQSYLYFIDASQVLCFLLMCILREFEVGVWKPQWGQVKPSETSCFASMCLLMSESFAVLYSQLYSQWYRPSSQRWWWPEKSSLKSKGFFQLQIFIS